MCVCSKKISLANILNQYMKFTLLFLTACTITLSCFSQTKNDEQLVRETAQSWFNSFNKHNYDDMPNYMSDDCFMINPYGLHGTHNSKTVALFNNAHATLLKNMRIKMDSMLVRFIKPDIAIVTAFSTTSGVYFSPDGVDRGNNKVEGDEHLVSTMVIMKQKNKWVFTHYQNSIIPKI